MDWPLSYMRTAILNKQTEADIDALENHANEDRGQEEQKEMDQTLYFNVLFRKGKKGPATDGASSLPSPVASHV